MMRNLLLVGVIVGSTASVPLVLQSNPAAILVLFQPTPPPSLPDRKIAPPAPERRAAATVSLAGRVVRVTPDRRGHFVGAFRINGRAVDALVDTGATLVAINMTTARRIGIALKPADFTGRVSTANGEARAAPALIESIQIGRITVDNVEAVVLDDEALKGSLVGMSFLKRLDRYSVEDDELVLQQ